MDRADRSWACAYTYAPRHWNRGSEEYLWGRVHTTWLLCYILCSYSIHSILIICTYIALSACLLSTGLTVNIPILTLTQLDKKYSCRFASIHRVEQGQPATGCDPWVVMVSVWFRVWVQVKTIQRCQHLLIFQSIIGYLWTFLLVVCASDQVPRLSRDWVTHLGSKKTEHSLAFIGAMHKPYLHEGQNQMCQFMTDLPVSLEIQQRGCQKRFLGVVTRQWGCQIESSHYTPKIYADVHLLVFMQL